MQMLAPTQTYMPACILTYMQRQKHMLYTFYIKHKWGMQKMHKNETSGEEATAVHNASGTADEVECPLCIANYSKQ